MKLSLTNTKTRHNLIKQITDIATGVNINSPGVSPRLEQKKMRRKKPRRNSPVCLSMDIPENSEYFKKSSERYPSTMKGLGQHLSTDFLSPQKARDEASRMSLNFAPEIMLQTTYSGTDMNTTTL